MTPEEWTAMQQQQDASAAWLQQERPDLVNPTRTAAEAEAYRQAYFNNTLPVLPAYAPSPASQETYRIYDFTGMNEWQRMNVDAPYRDVSYQEYVQMRGMTPDQYEQQKHNVFFHPSEVNPATLSPDLADTYQREQVQNVHEYYRQNPSPEFLAITGQYAATHYSSVGPGGTMYQYAATPRNPYQSDTAAGIAWDVGRVGASDYRLNITATREVIAAGGDPGFITYATGIYQQRPTFEATHQVSRTGQNIDQDMWVGTPIRMNVTTAELEQAGMMAIDRKTGLIAMDTRIPYESGIHTAPGDWGGLYSSLVTSKGIQAAPERLTGSKTLAYSPELESAGYRLIDDPNTLKLYVPYGEFVQQGMEGTKLAMDKRTGELAIYQYNERSQTWGLAGGGGRNALQSGMFSIGKALTPYTVEQGNVGSYIRPSTGETANLSRLGAEGYGGVVRGMNGTLLAPNEAVSRYYGSEGKYNLANYADQIAAGKSEAPGAKIPWTLPGGSPSLQYIDESGIVKGSAIDVSSIIGKEEKYMIVPNTPSMPFETKTMAPRSNMNLPNITGGVAGQFTMGATATVARDTSSGSPWWMNPIGSAMGAATGLYAWITEPVDWDASIKRVASSPTPAETVMSGGLLGYMAFGEKSPEVIKGAVGSGIDFLTGIVGWTPVADRMRTQAPGLQEFRTQKNQYETELTQMADYGKQQFGTTAEGKIRIDQSNPAAIAFNQKYGAAQDQYQSFMLSAKDKGLTTYEKGKLIENPDLTYDYGEFTKWGLGAGETIRGFLGFNKTQLESYGMQLEQKKGIEYIPEKIVYGAGYTLSTHPEKFISAYIGGAAMVFGGEVIGGVYQGSGLAARAAAWGAAHPTAAAISSGAIRYGIPAAFTGITYWGASEGLTASPERTTINLGKMTPELAGMMYGAASGYIGLRAADAGYIGFGNKEIKTIDLSKVQFEGGGEFIVKPGESILNRGAREIITEPSMRLTAPDRALYEQTTGTQPGLFDFSLVKDRMGAEIPPDLLPGVRPLLEGSDITSPFTRESWNPPSRAADRIATENWFRQIERDATISRNPNPATIQYKERAIAEAWRPVPESGAYPMDLLPGVGREGGLRRMSTPIPEDAYAGLAADMGLRIEYPRGLETRITGAGMSETMLESLVNPELLPIIGKASYGAELDAAITERAMASRVNPAIRAAEQQAIVPSVKGMPKEQFQFDTGEFFDIWSGIAEGEKRPAGQGRIPKGMQLDYLREALGRRTETFFIEEYRDRIGTPAMKEATFMDLAIYDMQRNAPVERYANFFKTRDGQDIVPVSMRIGSTREINSMLRGETAFDITIPDEYTGQLPGQSTGSRSRQKPWQEITPDQRNREMNDRTYDTIIRQSQEVRQMQTPDVAPMERVKVREITEPPVVPTFEYPDRPVTKPPFVPTIEIPTKDVPPFEPVPEEPIWPDIPPPVIIPKIPNLPGLGGGSGFQGPRGFYRFTERLSFASGAYEIALPRTRRATTSKVGSKVSGRKKTTSRRTR